MKRPSTIVRRRRQVFTDQDYVFALAVASRMVQVAGSGKRDCRLRVFTRIEERIRKEVERRAHLKRVNELHTVLQRTGLKGYLDEAAT